MSANQYINMFSAHLFWDVRREDLDLDKHSEYIIKKSVGIWFAERLEFASVVLRII